MTRFDGREVAASNAQSRRLPAAEGGLLADSVKALAGIYLGSALFWSIAALSLPIEIYVLPIAGGLLAVIFALVLRGLPRHHHPRFGVANIVTAVRASLASLVAAVILFSNTFGHERLQSLEWATAAAVLFALALDGVDGYLARRLHQASAFGARFDMEVDAFLILVLSVAAFILDKAGVWVLMIGAMRYLFVAAQWFQPALRADLPASFQRKLICVVQVAVLCSVLLPLVGQPVSGVICAAALALLIYSFAVDVIYLFATRKRPA